MTLGDVALTGATPAVEALPSCSLETVTPEMVQLLREREEARAEAHAAAQAARQMETFLGMAAHELKNPVTSSSLGVRMAARRLNVLLDRLPPQDPELAGQLAAAQDLLAHAQERLERLTRMVIDLLDLSRIQAGQLALHPEYRDLRSIVRAAVDEQRQLAPDMRIRLHLPDAQSVAVWADDDRLHQVVTNYLTNALKYAPADQPVDVRVEMQARLGSGDWVRVSVRDQGPGVPAEEQERVWEPFHQSAGVTLVGATTRGAHQSLGLGLYICKLIIEQHQGQVGVESAPRKGCTFWFALPMVPPEGQAQQCFEQCSA